MLSVGVLSATVGAQENRLRKHFEDVVTDGPQQHDFYERLVAAEPKLAAAATEPDGDVAAIGEQLSQSLAELLALQDERRQKRQVGKQGLPADYSDRLTTLMLVCCLPDLDWQSLKVNRNGRDIDLMPQLLYLVRSDFGVKSPPLQAAGPTRDIVGRWIETVGASLQGQQAIYWGLQNDLKDPCLTVARRILSQRGGSSLWLRPQDVAVIPSIRESMQRTAVAVVEKWGGESDAWALLKLAYQDDDTEAANVAAGRYRATPRDQALGVLIRMRGLNPLDYRMRESSGLYSNYSFQSLEDQAAARARFKAWWDFLPPWKVEEVTEAADIELDAAINLLLKNEFDDLAAKKRVVNRIEQQPQAAFELLATFNLVSDDQVIVAGVLLDRIASKMAERLYADTPTPAAVGAAREQFARLVGSDAQPPLFDEMVAAEPGLMAAFSAFLDAPELTQAFYGEVLIRLFMRRESALAQRFQQLTNQYVQSRIAAGKPTRAAGLAYPGNLPDDFFASLAAILFVRGEQPLEFPTPLLGLLNRCLYSGLENGTNQQKSPVQEFIRSAGDRGEALGHCLQSACLSADEPAEYPNAFSIALRYQLADPSLRLARRVCDPEFVFPNTAVRGNLLQLAIHSFISFGKAEEDLPRVVSLLKDEQRIGLGGVKRGQLRRYIEVRELALMAAKRMVGRNPEEMEGERITGYCPMRRVVDLDIIDDPERWEKIEQTAADWLVEFSGAADRQIAE
jgi:hypothetical protein